MPSNDIYASLGVKRRINAAGTLTRLGGALMAPEVLAAMAEAAQSSIDIAELQDGASTTIARLTGAEAGMVTTGAAAALTLGTAACMTGWDVARMAALPHAEGFAHEVLLPRTHHTQYAHAFQAAGARLIDIGHNDRGAGSGVRGLEAWEIEAVITPRTAAFAFAANVGTIHDLPTVVAVCRPRGIPVIVDAAAQLPPKANLRRFVELGADLIAFSGGKAIGGPQASGLLVGRRDLVGAALVQQIDMDVAPETWAPPALIDRQKLTGVPHHGIGRGFKAGKEEIVGLLVALERFVARDDVAANAALAERLGGIATALAGRRGLSTRLLSAQETGRVPVLELSIEATGAGMDAIALSRRLLAAERPVHLSERLAHRGILLLDPHVLRPEDDALLAETIGNALG